MLSQEGVATSAPTEREALRHWGSGTAAASRRSKLFDGPSLDIALKRLPLVVSYLRWLPTGNASCLHPALGLISSKSPNFPARSIRCISSAIDLFSTATTFRLKVSPRNAHITSHSRFRGHTSCARSRPELRQSSLSEETYKHDRDPPRHQRPSNLTLTKALSILKACFADVVGNMPRPP